jgi:hypothetical protein
MSFPKQIQNRIKLLKEYIKREWINQGKIMLDYIDENNPAMDEIDKLYIFSNWITENFNEKKENDYKLQKYREHLMAFRIQQYYFRAKLHIEYKFCRKRVNNFYDNVVNKKV